MYSVTKDSLNIGVLLLFSGSKDYTVTQVFITHCVWEYGELVIESDNHIYQYYRSYESNTSSGFTGKLLVILKLFPSIDIEDDVI